MSGRGEPIPRADGTPIYFRRTTSGARSRWTTRPGELQYPKAGCTTTPSGVAIHVQPSCRCAKDG